MKQLASVKTEQLAGGVSPGIYSEVGPFWKDSEGVIFTQLGVRSGYVLDELSAFMQEPGYDLVGLKETPNYISSMDAFIMVWRKHVTGTQYEYKVRAVRGTQNFTFLAGSTTSTVVDVPDQFLNFGVHIYFLDEDNFVLSSPIVGMFTQRYLIQGNAIQGTEINASITAPSAYVEPHIVSGSLASSRPVRWNDPGDVTQDGFVPAADNSAGSADLLDSVGSPVCIKVFRENAYVYFVRGIYRLRYIGGSFQFDVRLFADGFGVSSEQAIISTQVGHFGLNAVGLFFHQGQSARWLDLPGLREFIFDEDIDEFSVRGLHLYDQATIAFSYQSKGSSDWKVLFYRYDTQVWSTGQEGWKFGFAGQGFHLIGEMQHEFSSIVQMEDGTLNQMGLKRAIGPDPQYVESKSIHLGDVNKLVELQYIRLGFEKNTSTTLRLKVGVQETVDSGISWVYDAPALEENFMDILGPMHVVRLEATDGVFLLNLIEFRGELGGERL